MMFLLLSMGLHASENRYAEHQHQKHVDTYIHIYIHVYVLVSYVTYSKVVSLLQRKQSRR